MIEGYAFEPAVLDSMPLALAVLTVVFVGAIVQAGMGMGFGLTVAPILALLDPALVPVATLWLGGATSLAGAWRERSGIVWREVAIGAGGRALGVTAGIAILIHLTDRGLFSLVFGLVIALAVALSVIGITLAMNARNLTVMGFASGTMGAITSVGAPPLALIYQGVPAARARPTLAAFFVLGCVLNLAGAYGIGYGGWRDIGLALFMAPAAIAGIWAGRKLTARFDGSYRGLLLAVSGVAALALIARGVASLI